MWLDAGCRRVIASSPTRAPSLPIRSSSAVFAASRSATARPASPCPVTVRAWTGSVCSASIRSMSMPKPASIWPSFIARRGRMRSGSALGRARPSVTTSAAWSVRCASSRRVRRPRPRSRSRAQRMGSIRSMAASRSDSSPMGSGIVIRTAKWSGGRAGDTGSGADPIAWSSRSTSPVPKRRARPARGWPSRSPMRRRPRRPSCATVSASSRSAATGRGASAP